jgi:D-alanyl-D-alanine carboxypeptidase
MAPARPARRLAVVAGLTAAFALAVAGCAAATPAASPAHTELAGIPTAEVDGILQDTAAELHLPGAFLLLRTPDGEFTSAYGATVLDGDAAPTADTHVRIGSNTKTWTGTVILQLVGEGLLGLDDPVSAYRPDVPNGASITIRMLLNMRSGLYNYTEDLGIAEAMDADPQRAWDPEELVAVGLAGPPYFAPGEGYHYSNTNTVLLGLIAEQLTGTDLPTLFADRIFTPLGMRDSSYPAADDADLPEPLSHGYSFGTNVDTLDAPALDDAQLQEFFAGTLQPDDHTFDNPSWASAAGAGISTAHDLAIWAEALTDGALLDPELQAQRTAFEPTSASAAGAGYGLALADFAGYQGHTGELPGYNSFVARNPATGVTLVVWANLAPTGDGRDPATTIARRVVDSLG